jgi:rod shape determining protein RodA
MTSWLDRLGALRRLDWSLFTAGLLLAAFGLAALYSVTINVENPDYTQVVHQAVFMVVGLLVLLGAAALDYRVWWTMSWPLYLVGAGLLVAVLLFGETIRGTTGWFIIFGQTFQPVEIVRIFFVLQLSRFFATRLQGERPLQTLAGSGLLLLLYVGLLLLQPEFGYTALLVGVWFVFILLARIPKWYIGLLVILVSLAAVFSWFFVLQDYQKNRITTFLDPSVDPHGKSYNVTQSIVAIGSGRFFGRGLGLGPQSQLNFLPEQSTDFIFAVIAEELGFLGSVLVLGTFALLFARLVRAIRRANEPYTALLLTGFLALLFFQMFINIGMNLGLLPVTGIPLPFISYGGSALLANCLVLGIAQSVIVRQP